MRILIGCEASGVVREAFRRLGHDAWSCDLRPAEDGSPYHLQCDLLTILDDGWQRMIAHPDCTYLTNSAEWAYGDGPYHQQTKPGTLVGSARRAARDDAVDFVKRLWGAPIDEICLENPAGCLTSRFRRPTQYIHPYQFGADASKKTGLWLKGLPRLRPTMRIAGRLVEWPRGSGRMVERWSNQTDSGNNKLTPTDDRWAIRSLTYDGIARAMAEQWTENPLRSQLRQLQLID